MEAKEKAREGWNTSTGHHEKRHLYYTRDGKGNQHEEF